MKPPTIFSPGGKMQKHFQLGVLVLGTFLLLLIGSRLFSTLAPHTSAVTSTALASTAPGVYAGSGDGKLYKLDGDKGTLDWKVQVTDRNLPAAPAVANGIAYFSTLNEGVYAVNADTGSQLWHSSTVGGSLASPVVNNQVVYVSSTDSYLYALNAQNGSLLWRFDTAVGNETVAPTSVTVVNGVVYGSASDQVDHSYLFAVDAKTGKQLWRTETHNQLFTSVQVVNNVIYFASSAITHAGGPHTSDSYVYAYNAQTGTQLWVSSKIGDVILSAPAISNNLVYVGSQDTYIYALDAQTGKLTWRHKFGGPIYATPLVSNGTLFAGIATASSTRIMASSRTTDSTLSSDAIVALDAKTGNLIWQQAQVAHYAGTPLALAGNTVYVGTQDNQIYALDATTGSVNWHYQMASANPFNNAPITVAP